MGTTRRIPLNHEFMDKAINDVVFAKMFTCATYNPKEEVYYLCKDKTKPLFKTIAEEQNWKTTKTVKNHLQKLIDKGFIQDSIMELNYDDKAVYTFAYEKDGSEFEFVDSELLEYMTEVLSQNCIKVYTYLYHKLKQHMGGYKFTYAELMIQLGYSTKTHAVDTKIKYIVQTLKKLGLIQYEEFYDERMIDGRTVNVLIHRLYDVAKNMEDIHLEG